MVITCRHCGLKADFTPRTIRLVQLAEEAVIVCPKCQTEFELSAKMKDTTQQQQQQTPTSTPEQPQREPAKEQPPAPEGGGTKKGTESFQSSFRSTLERIAAGGCISDSVATFLEEQDA